MLYLTYYKFRLWLIMQNHERYSEAKKITLIGAIINAILGTIKVISGYFFHSNALVADGFHSFSDLITDIMVLLASKYGSNAADDSHPYGHQRIETAGTLLLSLILILAGFGIGLDALEEIIYNKNDLPNYLALPIAIISIFINEALFHYTRRIGKKIDSDLIIANAWHRRSDAASSIVVLIGLIGSLAGFKYLDAIAAILVGFMIIKMGITYGWNSVKELIDTAVEPQLTENIKKVIMKVDGVDKIHQLRSRMMGRDVFIDVHILVSPYISVSEGHYIAQHVHQTLMNKIDNVKDVTVHVDPEDDEVCCPSLHLPNRKAIEKNFIKLIQKSYPEVESWNFHYLDGKLTIDLYCEDKFNNWVKLRNLIKKELALKPEITVKLYQRH